MPQSRKNAWRAIGVVCVGLVVSAGSASLTYARSGTTSVHPDFHRASNTEITPLPSYHKHVTITFWSWVPGTQVVVKAFEKAYPSIRVNYQNVGGGATELDKLTTAIKAGSGAPDVVQIPDYWLPSIVQTGGLRNLDTYGAKTLLRDFYPWIQRQIQFNGGVYGIPQDQDPLALMYNQVIFDKYHLSVPTTWTQYARDAQILHAKNPNISMTLDFSASNVPWLTAQAWAIGGHIAQSNRGTWTYDMTAAPWVKTLSYWQNMAYKGWIPDNVTWESIQYIHSFAQDTVATLIGPDWEVPLLEEWAPKSIGQWRVAKLPGWSSGKPTSGVWGGGVESVTTQSSHPEASYLLAAWINTDRQAIELNWTNGGEMSAATAGASLPAFNAPNRYFGNQRIGQVFLQEDKYVPKDWTWPPNVAYMYSEWPSLLNKAIASKSSLVSTLGLLQSQLEQEAKISGISVSGG